MDKKPHGSFAFKFETNYTLISVAESWNAECIKIYSALLRKRMESKPDLRRCVILDGRKWGFQTPECHHQFEKLNHYIAGYYKALFIAYYLAPDNFMLSEYLINSANAEFTKSMHWNFFQNLHDVVFWLNSEGFEIPTLTNSDFPEPVSSIHYLQYL